MNRLKNAIVLILTNAFSNMDTKWIQLLPYGNVHTKKGDFIVDDEAANQIIKNFSNRKNDIVVDYEHQTLEGVIAPAAGWIKQLEFRGKDGIWGEVEWTPKAKDFITNKEYKYLSPVIFINKNDKRVNTLHSAALTNDPAIDGMNPIANKFEEGNENMDLLKKILAALGLDENATEEQILKAIEDIKTKETDTISANKQVLELLGLKDDSKLEDVKGKIIALKNPSGYVSAEEFNKLKDSMATKERDEVVTMALKSGKITPAQKEWAEGYAKMDIEGFRNFVKNAPQIVPLDKVVLKDDPKPNVVTEESEIQVCKLLGISSEDYKKFKEGAN